MGGCLVISKSPISEFRLAGLYLFAFLKIVRCKDYLTFSLNEVIMKIKVIIICFTFSCPDGSARVVDESTISVNEISKIFRDG
jgi:hypothetical protein